MASSTFDGGFGGGIDPQLKRMVGLSALAHLSIAALLITLAGNAPLPVNYSPSIQVALVDLPEVTEDKDVKLGQTKPKEPAPPQEKKPEAKKAKPAPEKKKVIALAEEKKTAKKPVDTRQELEAKRRASMESSIDRLKKQRVAVARVRQRALETDAPEGTAGGYVRGTGAIRTMAYDAHLVAVLRENWELPSTFMGQNLHTNVFMKVDRNGRVVEWRIVGGSGNSIYDDTVYRAMTKTQQRGDLPVPEPEVYESIKAGYNIDFNPADFFSGDRY